MPEHPPTDPADPAAPRGHLCPEGRAALTCLKRLLDDPASYLPGKVPPDVAARAAKADDPAG
jgi:hypothetical protein